MDKKTAIFLANGCEEVEALTTVDLLRRAEIPVTMVSINGTEEVTGSHGIRIMADTTIEKLDFDAYDMLICPGGIPGTPNLAACPALTKQLVKFQEEGKEVAAICAAPSILAGLGLLRGKTAACNPSKENVLRAGGANLVFAPVAEDGNIITSRAMGTAVPFGLKIVEHYRGREFAESLRKTILFAEEG